MTEKTFTVDRAARLRLAIFNLLFTVALALLIVLKFAPWNVPDSVVNVLTNVFQFCLPLALYEDVFMLARIFKVYLEKPTYQTIASTYGPFALRKAITRVYGHGYVYVIRDIDVTGFCKIGRSVNPPDRIGDFFVKLPFSIRVECVIETDDCYELEAALHTHYSAKHIRGEWFNLEANDIEYIKSLEPRASGG